MNQTTVAMSGGTVLILHRMTGRRDCISEKKDSQLFRLVKANGKKLWSTAMGVQLRHAGYTAHTQLLIPLSLSREWQYYVRCH